MSQSAAPFIGAGAGRVGFARAVSRAFANYATFSGRASRAEYWWFMLFYAIGTMVVAMLDAVVFQTYTVKPAEHSVNASLSWFSGVWDLVMILPTLSLGVRRLHDIGRSGWWLLISLIPLVGFIMLLIWTIRRGDPGPNEYGPDPLGA